MQNTHSLTRVYTFVVSGLFLAALLLTGCSEQTITGPNPVPQGTETSITDVPGNNQNARHNDGGDPIYADKNGENSTTYGGSHNL